jgi:hypothetical protein
LGHDSILAAVCYFIGIHICQTIFNHTGVGHGYQFLPDGTIEFYQLGRIFVVVDGGFGYLLFIRKKKKQIG